MGITNTRHNLEKIIATEKGTRQAVAAEIAEIEAGIEELCALKARLTEIDENIAAAERLIRRDHPEWSSDSVVATTKANRHSAIPFGMLGRTALDVLRDGPPDGMRTRAIAAEVVRRFDLDPTDRKLLDSKTNSLGQYLKQNEGDLVRHDGEKYYKRWALIRDGSQIYNDKLSNKKRST